MNYPVGISIAIADDHVIMRKGIVNLISNFGNNIEVALEANDGNELLLKLAKAEVLPDICLLDLNMKGMSGFEALTTVKKKWPGIKILIFTSFTNDYSFLRVLKGCANGVISKGCDPGELKHAITEICTTGFYYSPNLPADILHSFRSKEFYVPRITGQEKAFLALCCTELTYGEIADKMKVGIRTVDGYRDNLFHKLGVTSRAGLIMFVVKSGVVPFPI